MKEISWPFTLELQCVSTGSTCGTNTIRLRTTFIVFPDLGLRGVLFIFQLCFRSDLLKFLPPDLSLEILRGGWMSGVSKVVGWLPVIDGFTLGVLWVMLTSAKGYEVNSDLQYTQAANCTAFQSVRLVQVPWAVRSISNVNGWHLLAKLQMNLVFIKYISYFFISLTFSI